MAISVDWPNLIINIPKADTTLVTFSPHEIRELNMNDLRLALKALEDDLQGINWPKTHDHYPPFDIGGVELARVIDITNDYTVTFENGSYAVNLVGANTNLPLRLNLNNVQVRPSNTAGLATSSAIEFGEYDGHVLVDVDNITGRAAAGSSYYTGTGRRPANNLTDAIALMAYYGFQEMWILGTATFDATHDIDGKIVLGQSHVQNVVTLAAGTACTNTVFRELEVQGVLDGGNELTRCIVGSLTYFDGHIHNSGLKGTIVLAGGLSSVISNCFTLDPFSPPTVDMGGSGQDLSMPGYNGMLTIRNLTGPTNFAGIGLDGGQVLLDTTTVTAGTVFVSGVGKLTDELGERIPSGLWNGGVTIINDTITEESVAKANWRVVEYDSVGGVDEEEYPAGFPERPINNVAALDAVLTNNNRIEVHARGAMTLTGDWSGRTIRSDGYERLTVTLDNTIAEGLVLEGLTFGGTVASGEIEATKCKCTGVVGGSMDFDDVQMAGTYKPAAGGRLRGDRCSSSEVGGCIIDANGGATINMANAQGIFTLTNATASANQHGFTGAFVLTLYGGSTPGMSVTGGTFMVAGTGLFLDHLGAPLASGAWNGATIISRVLPAAILDEPTGAGTLAEVTSASYKLANNRNWIDQANSQLVIYEDDGVSEWRRFDLKDEAGAPATGAVFERVPV